MPADPLSQSLSQSLSPDDLPDPSSSMHLLARAQAGDGAALEELIGRYQERLRRIVSIQLGASLLRRDLDSMDVVQSTFRAALPKIGELRPRSPAGILGWLATIATNRMREAWRHQHRAKRDVDREVHPGEEPGVEGSVPTDAAPPEDVAELAEIRDLLDREVAHLPHDQRQVVLLRDYCGESWERIATELQREPGAARQLHQRAWIRLREGLRRRLGTLE